LLKFYLDIVYSKAKMENPRHSVNDPGRNEIDLSIIFDSIGRKIDRVGDGITYVFYLIKRYFKLFIGFIILGAIFGYAAYYVTKPYYKGSMTLVLADIRNDFVEDQLNKLENTVKEDNFVAVASMLNVSEEEASQIKKMAFSNLDTEIIADDSVLTGSPFRIELSLYDNKLFPTMEDALANYLESNRYFSKLKNIREREIKGTISKLNSEIESIDSIKTTVASPRGPVNGFVFGQPVDPTNLYRESISMYREKAALEAELEQLDNIQIVNGFAPRLKPEGPQLLLFLGIGVIATVIFGIVFANNLESKKKRSLEL